ncbi:MAG: hypothetical protein Q7T11_04335, partial [Deltaproteobacteria bacterium]|nr:hypothetical protein [Deltaproteobacteria bacterium]
MKTKLSKIILSSLLALFVAACSGSGGKKNDGRAPSITKDPVSFGDNVEDFSPASNETAPFNPGEDDSASEADCNPHETTVAPLSIQFGANEIGQSDCQSVSVKACTDFTAEINTAEGSDGVPEFSVIDQKKSGFKICYQPATLGLQTGRAHVIVGSGAGMQVFVVSFSGEGAP